MAFIDELTIELKAGRGGDGVVRWRHEKGKEFSGAAGGDGGKGGDVYIRAVRDIGLLARYRHSPRFEAERGDPGAKNSMHGKSGEDFVLDLPVGSIVTHQEKQKTYTLLAEGQTIQVLSGGNGGYGNEHFKASTNTKPMESTPGKPGEDGTFYVELELFADAGFVGFPNAGKSSLLNALTRAHAKVASYQFTTLEPNLGDMEGFILADIPGLIEGAAEGKGLGHTFLRHIKRTKATFHCISLEHEDCAAAYKAIRKELELYNTALVQKPEIVIFTKTDVIEHAADVESKMNEAMERINALSSEPPMAYLSVTVLDDGRVKELKDTLVKILRTLEK